MDWEPLTALVPDHAPEAVQEVALVADQINVEALPLATALEFALKLNVGAAAATDTVAAWVALPPLPVQVSPKVPFALSAPVDWEPLTALVPDHAPEAAQEVALVEDQVKVAAAPLLTVLGAADTLTVGAGLLTDTVVD